MYYQSDWNRQATANASMIDEEIDQLRSLMTKPEVFWRHAKEIVALFKRTNPLRQRDRDLLWEKYAETCRGMKRL